jgi:hypothetical protein
VNMHDLFWLGAIWNEIDGERDDRERERREAQAIAESQGASCPAETHPPKHSSRQPMKLPIERMVELEQKFQVTIRGATADVDAEYGPQVTLRGELTAAAGKLDEDLRIMATVYNAADEVIGMNEIQVSARGFVGVEPFQLLIPCSGSYGPATRVRLHLRAS